MYHCECPVEIFTRDYKSIIDVDMPADIWYTFMNFDSKPVTLCKKLHIQLCCHVYPNYVFLSHCMHVDVFAHS